MTVSERMQDYKQQVEAYLDGAFVQPDAPYETLLKAMR